MSNQLILITGYVKKLNQWKELDLLINISKINYFELDQMDDNYFDLKIIYTNGDELNVKINKTECDNIISVLMKNDIILINKNNKNRQDRQQEEK